MAEIGECSFCPRAVPQTWGTILDGKNGPPPPPKNHQGKGVSIRPSPGPDPPTTKGGGLRSPSHWIPPRAALFQVSGLRGALRSTPPGTGARAEGRYVGEGLAPPAAPRAEGRYEVRPGGHKLKGEQPWGVSKEGQPKLPLFGRFKGVVQEGGNRNPPSWGFRGVVGGLLWPQSSPPKNTALPLGQKIPTFP